MIRLLLLAFITAVVAAGLGIWIARQRGREALAERRKAHELEEDLAVWTEAETSGLARPPINVRRKERP